MQIKIERNKWQPTWPDETCIIDKRKQEQFQITLKQGEDIEIEFDWDYGFGGRGTERMTIPVKLLRELLDELDM